MATSPFHSRQFQDIFNVVSLTKATVNMPSALTGSGTFAVSSLTVPGAALGDFVLVAPATDVLDAAVVGNVTSANTVELVLLNNTAGAVDLPSATYFVAVLRANPAAFV